MKGPRSIAVIFAEVDDLVSIVTYGKERLDTFTRNLKQFEVIISKLDTREGLTAAYNHYRRLHAQSQTTESSLEEWRHKAATYLHIVEQLAKDKALLSRKELKELHKIKSKISHLLKMVSAQQNRVLQLRNKFNSITESLGRKEVQLKPNYQRAKEPQLVEA